MHNTIGATSTLGEGKRAGARLPCIIAVGPPRTGTTWLDAVLRGHIGLPSGVKETQFFKWNYDKGIDWYAWHFRKCPPDLPIMEICPSYFDFPPARERIKKHIPDCKIICTLREPVSRLYSQFRLYSGFAGYRSLEEMIEKTPRIWESAGYVVPLREWFALFGRENVLVEIYCNLRDSPQAFLDSVSRFSGIPRIGLAKNGIGTKRVKEASTRPRSRLLAMAAGNSWGWLNSHRLHPLANLFEKPAVRRLFFEGGEEFGPLPPELERRLRERFRPDVEELEKLLGRDLSRWK